MLSVGDIAPQFTLADHDGRAVRLSDLLADGRLILFFYPADFTPVCTREAGMFRDAYAALAAAGTNIAGISPDDNESHARFRDRHGLVFTLLADPDKEAIKAYGVNGPLGFGVRRATFLIDTDRRIRAAVKADLRLEPHNELIQAALTGS